MRFLRRWIYILLLSIRIMTFALPVVAASNTEYPDLKITVEMDKEHYEEDEPITATITALNTGSRTVTIVNLEQLIPEGYVLSENSQVSTKDVEVGPGQEIKLQVTFEGDPNHTSQEEQTDTFWDTLLYGETFGIPNLILIVVAVLGFAIFMMLT